MRCGEVWWADLPAPAGRRPVVLLSRNEGYVVNLDTITTIPRQTLTAAIGPLSPEKLAAVERSVMFALGLAARRG